MLDLKFSPDGATLALALEHHPATEQFGVVLFLNPRTGKTGSFFRVPTKGQDRMTGIAFSPDGRMLAVAKAEIIHLWEMATCKERAKIRVKQWVYDFTFTPDGRRVATNGERDIIQLWDLYRIEGDLLYGGDMSRLWAALRGEDSVLAYRAVRTMTTLPAQSHSFLRRSLCPASLPSKPPPHEDIKRCLNDLESDTFTTREKAAAELKKYGTPAVTALRDALKPAPSLEVRKRIETILEEIEHARIAQQLQHIRSVEVLEHIGTAEERAHLEELAKGVPEARLTQEAKASLARLQKRPLAKH